MASMKGPGIFLAQFLRDDPPYDNLKNIGGWVASLGYRGVQIPTWDARVIDLDKAAQSKAYCDDLKATLAEIGLEVSELSAHLQGQVLAIHPAYELGFQPFYPEGLRDAERTAWATEQLKKAVLASVNLGTTSIPVLSGGFAWHMMYPWPQR
ncbi:MAG: sugar phosphate isomerase/epimerase, partial [Planctomycetota bacterium]